jgi:hypothetical protein
MNGTVKKRTRLLRAFISVDTRPGYFYTGNYRLGAISLLTNGALILLAYDGYRRENSFQMIFFSIVELSFYNYSIVGSIRSAYEYNDSSYMKKEILAGIKTGF